MRPDIAKSNRLLNRFSDVPVEVIVGAPRPSQGSSHPPITAGCEVYIRSCNPLRSGTELETSTGSAVCTFGFNGIRRVDGRRMIMSAGHCIDQAYHSGAYVGPMWAQSNSGAADAQVHDIQSGWQPSRWYIANRSQQAVQVTSVYRESKLGIGATACFTGQVSGPFTSTTRCGGVTTSEWSGKDKKNRSFVDQFIFNMATTNGDSGGGIFSSGSARGIMWGFEGSSTGGSYAVHVENLTGTDIALT